MVNILLPGRSVGWIELRSREASGVFVAGCAGVGPGTGGAGIAPFLADLSSVWGAGVSEDDLGAGRVGVCAFAGEGCALGGVGVAGAPMDEWALDRMPASSKCWALVVERYLGSYTGGTFGGSIRTMLPSGGK